jgi:glycosyltransferase involved in cell wall biosynthesis
MTRIMLLVRSLEAGGAERQLCVLAKSLHENGLLVKVVVFYENKPLEIDLLNSGVPLLGLKRKGRWDLVPFFFRLLYLIKTEKPDILYSYLPVANIWAVFVKIFLPHITVIWGVRASNVELKQYNWQTQFTDHFEAQLSRIPNWIVCNSHAGLLHAVGKGFPKNRMSVIPNGIDMKHFFPNRELGKYLRWHWNVQDNQKLIGMVARVDPMKDYPNFLHACALLMHVRQDVRFVCIGDGPEDLIKEYKDLALSLGLGDAVIWAGHLEDMLRVYNAIDILVSASAYGEGFSNVIGEAMACGIPCVATNVGDSALLVETFGELVPPSDPQALRDGIMNLLQLVSNKKDFIAGQLVQRVRQDFGVDALVFNTIQLFEQLVASQNEITLKNT